MQTRILRSIHRLAAVATVATMALGLAPAAQAQRSDENRPWLERCGEWGGRDRYSACREQELTMQVTGGELSVNARPNGGITVVGSDRRDIRVVARMQANARSQADADEILREIAIVTDRGLRAEGPRTGRDEGWSVSYVLEVPRQIDLTLSSTNGGVRVEGVTGRLEMSTTNGGITLASVAGDVRGRISRRMETQLGDGGALIRVMTTNGGVSVARK